MPASLLDALAGRSCVFIVGKGGVGKTTAAGSVALALAERAPTHLISTDPAHSIGDLFGQTLGPRPIQSSCSPHLTLEEFDAKSFAKEWIAGTRADLAELIEAGTYLASAEATGLLDASVPGVDEVMAALRLVELTERSAQSRQYIVVDTAPMGHTLRLLDAGDVLAGWNAVFRAMAEKATVVASSLVGRPLRLSAERLLDRVDRDVLGFRNRVLGAGAFVVVYRNEPVVLAQTNRLRGELSNRKLLVAAVVSIGPPGDTPVGQAAFSVPVLEEPSGCNGARRWFEELRPAASWGSRDSARKRDFRQGGGAAWVSTLTQRCLLFVGKGGVGKTTCAAAAALGLARSRAVLLCSTDPAGALATVLDETIPAAGVALSPTLRVRQIDALEQFAVLRDQYRDDVREVFARLGFDDALRLDRNVLEKLWNLAPPGVDEVIALLEMMSWLESGETLVIDAAPTGHFLRLLAMPQLALEWAHALMRVFLQVRSAHLDETIEGVLRFSKRLKQLSLDLTDAAVTGALLVTLDESMVRAEMKRLYAALGTANVPVAALVVNRALPPDRTRTAPQAQRLARGVPVIFAPAQQPPPTGRLALHRFLATWEIVP
jgi:arsenite-transporting ATPase